MNEPNASSVIWTNKVIHHGKKQTAAERCINKWVKRWQKNKKHIDGKYGKFARHQQTENAIIYDFIKDLQRLTK